MFYKFNNTTSRTIFVSQIKTYEKWIALYFVHFVQLFLSNNVSHMFSVCFSAIEAFSKTIISETILRRLLKQDIVYSIKKNKDWRNDPACVIYQRGKPADYFVLVLEGRVEVTIGQENLVFESGPFTYFGTQALAQNVGVGELCIFLYKSLFVSFMLAKLSSLLHE